MTHEKIKIILFLTIFVVIHVLENVFSKNFGVERLNFRKNQLEKRCKKYRGRGRPSLSRLILVQEVRDDFFFCGPPKTGTTNWHKVLLAIHDGKKISDYDHQECV